MEKSLFCVFAQAEPSIFECFRCGDADRERACKGSADWTQGFEIVQTAHLTS